QIAISPALPQSPAATVVRWQGEALGLSYDVGFDWRPTLVIDLDDPVSVSLLAVTGPSQVTLGTDLWLSRPSGTEAVRDTDPDGKRGAHRFIEVSLNQTT